MTDQVTVFTLEILPEFCDELQDIEHHNHLIILYLLDRTDRTALSATPPRTGIDPGVFSTRSPNCQIQSGLALLTLSIRGGNRLFMRGAETDCIKE
jgi:tRNA (Thr-GGU) A37 N-methylase